MATNATGGKIPEYTTAEAVNWFSGLSDYVTSAIDITLLVCACLGFVLLLGGFAQIAKENREAAFGGGGGRRYGVWMVVGGAGLGSLGVLFLYLVGFFRPALV